MRNIERHRDIVDGDDRGIAFPTLKAAEILLTEASEDSELLLGQACRFAEPGAIVAHKFPHIHARNHWRSAASWFIYYSMYYGTDRAEGKSDEPVIPVQLADGSYAALNTQRVGRMGELIVEFELLKRGWIVGNFNATTLNSVGWDLFATKGRRSVKLRVKAKRPSVANFRWSAKADGTVFIGDAGADDDFVAAVSFAPDGSYSVYIIPTSIVAQTLAGEHERWLQGSKADGSARKATPMRSVYLDDRQDGAPGRGFAMLWKAYEGAWASLEC